MEEIEEAVQSCDIVHTYLWYARLYHLADVCEKYGKELSLDASFGETLDESARAAILGKCHWGKMNEVEACQVTGLASAEEALICLHKDVQCGIVVTLGAKGSIGMLHGDDRIIRIAPQNLGEFRDACGAGDAYSAGMLYGLARGYDLEKAMAIGSHTSGLAVTWPGGTDAAMRQLRDKF